MSQSFLNPPLTDYRPLYPDFLLSVNLYNLIRVWSCWLMSLFVSLPFSFSCYLVPSFSPLIEHLLCTRCVLRGFPDGANGKEPTCKCRRSKRLQFHPWVRKTLWRRKWQPTPMFLLGESHDRGAWWTTVHGVTESKTLQKWLSTQASVF